MFAKLRILTIKFLFKVVYRLDAQEAKSQLMTEASKLELLAQELRELAQGE